jgi:hypothetical protein
MRGVNWTTFASTALGAVIAVISGLLVDRSRWKRQLDQSWRDRRFEAYERFLSVMHEQVSAARSLATTKGLLEGPPPIGVKEGLRRITDADDRLAPAYEAVHVLGGTDVGGSAQAWRNALWQLSDYARGIEEANPAAWQEAYDRYRLARDAFRSAVRKELGIPGNGFDRSPRVPSTRPPRRPPIAEPPSRGG